ncbi:MULTISPECIES: alpha-ketoglutarate-dependent dioxygenase AlkB [Pseudomonadota]|uniref:2OG-Fe(II) oxygenase n=1 Tax=Stutzerimonas stutzeri TaxID=316 RepID=A0A2N8SZD0_STUST|nr:MULTISPECIES: alpha-ketoglutarate-dependent dioxygenase AlkB [Pseudomonadota]KWT95175.1 hypothetical protein APY03_2526 [Variovorax sp. WDL1]MCQ4249765.1 alpha-ketoglutarate-dependent dioxygenase AlkB [Stutzerimonas stutzeri]PNG07849.1 2OG-Fe(II) oxygenase [Stutzerimonas stutzeri]PNG59741.1 hypothetical protein CHC07_01470 [Variovorax sp. B4]PNG60468.1 hypothetical protein CHC06_00365 [Variovorax sp. B2]
MNATQGSLFDAGPVEASIPGLVYQPGFLSADEERDLLDIIASLPLQAARYKEYLARRRVVSFGGSFDYDANRLLPAAALDARLKPLQSRVAAWLGVAPEALVHALVSEYAPGTPLGWHRDVPDFERIVGVSLGGSATLRFRPYPYEPSLQRQVVRLEVAPRSIYRMEDEARWGWQHSVEAPQELRWSITLRTKVQPRSRP